MSIRADCQIGFKGGKKTSARIIKWIESSKGDEYNIVVANSSSPMTLEIAGKDESNLQWQLEQLRLFIHPINNVRTMYVVITEQKQGPWFDKDAVK